MIIPKISTTITRSDKNINTYYIADNGTYYGDLKSNTHSIRPIIKLKGDLIIKDGIGTKNVPIVLE